MKALIMRTHGPQILLTASALLFAACRTPSAPGLQTPLPDQQTELSLKQAVQTPWKLFESLPERQWIPGSGDFSAMDPNQRKRVTRQTVGKPSSSLAFTAKQTLRALRLAGAKIPSSPMERLPEFRWQDTNTIRLRHASAIYHWKIGELKAKKVLELPSGVAPSAIANDDSRAAYILDHQLFLQVGTERKQISSDGSKDVVYGGPAHRSEFGIHDGLWWSPNGRFLAFYREDLRPVTVYPYVDHTVMPPTAVHGRYPMAGRNNSVVKVGVYDTELHRLVYLQHGSETDIYWTNVTFSPDDQDIYAAIVNRGQDHMQLLRFSPLDGSTQHMLFEERDAQWVEPEHGPIFLDSKPGQFLWFSQRDGYRQLYLYKRDGTLVRQVTKAAFDIQDFAAFTPGCEHALVHASGSDPLQMHLWQVELATSLMSPITSERGWHTSKLNKSGTAAIDNYSSLNLPGRSSVIDISTSKPSHTVEVGHKFPELGTQNFFHVNTKDQTKLHGTVILPPNLDKTKQYPALLNVYGGPHSQLVKDRWLGGSSTWLHYMATQGFVVCTLDNRGTDNRGIDFAQSVHRKLSSLETEDQLLAVQHLHSMPFVDKKRIGVHGWSYGGYMTLNLMLRSPGTFACAAAGAPVTDWAQYETGYTERYMDTPAENPRGYQQASLAPLAKDLRGRLLIIHGTNDQTVMWSHSLALVDAFVKAEQLVDYMPYPMQKHGIRGPGRPHLYRLLTRYFQDHLGGPK
jgi:dipeptidyl-peptidase-4